MDRNKKETCISVQTEYICYDSFLCKTRILMGLFFTVSFLNKMVCFKALITPHMQLVALKA